RNEPRRRRERGRGVGAPDPAAPRVHRPRRRGLGERRRRPRRHARERRRRARRAGPGRPRGRGKGRARSRRADPARQAACPDGPARSAARGSRPVMRWTVHGERPIYESDWVTLALADVELPNGERVEHHLIRIPEKAAAAVVHDPERGILMLWRHRFITDSWGWEIPAGRLEPGETPEQAAARETLEETGWAPGPLRPVGGYHPAPGLVEQTFHVFATDGASRERDPDGI